MRRALLVVWLAVLIAGCQAAVPSPMPTPDAWPTPSPTAGGETPTATPTGASTGPLVVTLNLWLPEDLSPYGEDPAASLLLQRLEEFRQAYPGLQVQVTVKRAEGRGGLLDFLRTASAAAPAVLPDLVVLDVDDFRVAAQAGLVQPLDGLLLDELLADGFPFAGELGQVGGQAMGLPLAVDLEHAAYAPALVGEMPVSWTAVLSLSAPFAFPAAGQDGRIADATLAQYLGAGGRLTDGQGNPQLEAEPLTAVLDFYARASAAGVVSPTVVLSLADADACWALLQNGQAGVAVVDAHRFWTERLPGLAPAPLPSRDGRPVALVTGGWLLAVVTSDPQRQQQAMGLMEWLLEPSFAAAWTEALGYLPAGRGALAAWAVTGAERDTLAAVLESAHPPLAPPLREAVGAPLQVALESVLRGRRGPAEAAATAAQAVGP